MCCRFGFGMFGFDIMLELAVVCYLLVVDFRYAFRMCCFVVLSLFCVFVFDGFVYLFVVCCLGTWTVGCVLVLMV